MNVLDEHLTGLTTDWAHWPAWSQRCLARRARGQWVIVTPFNRRWAVIAGPLDQPGAYTDLWLYTDPQHAYVAATDWSGLGEPKGWAYHPRTRRQRFRPDTP